jgi:hypothetical protein
MSPKSPVYENSIRRDDGSRGRSWHDRYRECPFLLQLPSTITFYTPFRACFIIGETTSAAFSVSSLGSRALRRHDSHGLKAGSVWRSIPPSVYDLLCVSCMDMIGTTIAIMARRLVYPGSHGNLESLAVTVSVFGVGGHFSPSRRLV